MFFEYSMIFIYLYKNIKFLRIKVTYWKFLGWCEFIIKYYSKIRNSIDKSKYTGKRRNIKDITKRR